MYKAAWAFLIAAALAGNTASAQNRGTDAPKTDKASAYYHYTVAHMYAELAGDPRAPQEYINKAIENYKEALKADPTAPMLAEELTEVYIGANRMKDAVNDAEEALKQNPNDVNAHRMLARVYTRQIGDQQNHIDEAMLHKASGEYQKITDLDPTDVDSLLMLGRLRASNTSPLKPNSPIARC